MSNGTMGDPMKCKLALVGVASAVITNVGVPAVVTQATDNWYIRSAMYGFEAVMLEVQSRALHRMLSPRHSMWMLPSIKKAWQDCGGDGWLKKHLDSAKAKFQVGVEKAKSLVPQPAPELVPIPISSYAVSAEAVARRATSSSTIAKGVAYSVGAGLAVLAGAAMCVMARGAPMMDGATAGFSATTSTLQFSSNQNFVL